MLLLFLGRGAVGRPAVGLFFDFEPRVDVISEETCLLAFKVPDFVQTDESVALFQGFFDLRGAPGPGQLSL